MKHLKSFKIFESSYEDDLLGTINDILLPISDSGIGYKIEDLDNIGLIHIKIDGQSEEINDCVHHLTNYLKDLGHEYFVGGKIKNETHISIENNFSKEIERDFLEIIKDLTVIESGDQNVSYDNRNSITVFNNANGHLFYDYSKVYSIFESKYSLNESEINEVVRYMVGKHLKLEAFKPFCP